MKEFPELSENDHAKITTLDEEWMKSDSGKTRWRDFIAAYVSISSHRPRPIPVQGC